LKAIGQTAQDLGKFMAKTGAALTAPLAGAVWAWTKGNNELYRLSQQTGLSAAGLSALKLAAEESGLEFEQVAESIGKMQNFVYKAASGSVEAKTALVQLGLTVADLAKKTPEQQLAALADGLQKVQNPTQRAGLAMQVFSEAGVKLLPLLNQGSAGLARFYQEAQKLGLIKSAASLRAAHDLAVAWDRLTKVGGRMKSAIGEALAPMFTSIAQTLTPIVKGVVDWVKANPELVQQIFLIGAGLVGAGTALAALGGGLAFASTIFGGLATGAGILGTALAAILSPVGLLVGGAAVLAAYLVNLGDVAATVGDWFSETFGDTLTTVKDTIAAIGDALAGGDIKAAAAVGLAGLKLEWTRLQNWLYGLWDGLKSYWDSLTYGLAEVFLSAAAKIRGIWADVCAGLSKMWNRFISSTVMESISNLLMPIIARIQGVNVEDARKALKEDYAARRNQRPRFDAEADAEAAASKRQIDDELQQRTRALDQEREAKQKAREEDAKAREQELRDAAAEWSTARDTAREVGRGARARSALENNPVFAAPEGPMADITRRTSAVTGTFNAAATWGMGGQSAMDRTARATEKTAEYTRKIADASGDGLAFQ
jgi:hypothetical protein